MQKKDFLTSFPSLKGKEAYPLKYKIPFKEHKEFKTLSDAGQAVLENDYLEVEVYPENAIQKHCVDKQRIRDLCKEFDKDFDFDAEDRAISFDNLFERLKELGLEE